jgi:hypothetical protein
MQRLTSGFSKKKNARKKTARKVKKEVQKLTQVVAEKKVLVEETQDMEDRAMGYLNLIKNEVVRIKNGKESLIELDRDESEKSGCNQITRISVLNWFAEISEKGTEQESSSPTTEAEKPKSGNTVQKNNEITTFLLAQALAELVDKAREKKFISPELNKNGNPISLVKKDKSLNMAALARYVFDNTDHVVGHECGTVQKSLSKMTKRVSEKDAGSISVDEIEATLKKDGNQLANHNLEDKPYK